MKMKIKPLYMYGVIFVIIIAAIVFTSTGNSEKMTEVSTPNSEMGMPNDSIHSGMGEGAPSKSNVKADFWTKLEEAKAEFDANPKDTSAMKSYALLLGMSHQTEKALELYEKILAVNPNRVDILLAEGLAYFNSQNYQMAEAVTMKIIALDKNNIEAQYNLGVIKVSKGDKEGARKVWKTLSEKHPDHEIGKLALSSIERIKD